MCYVYTWCPVNQRWLLAGCRDTEDVAKEFGRELWRGGAAGIRIDALRTIVENLR